MCFQDCYSFIRATPEKIVGIQELSSLTPTRFFDPKNEILTMLEENPASDDVPKRKFFIGWKNIPVKRILLIEKPLHYTMKAKSPENEDFERSVSGSCQ